MRRTEKTVVENQVFQRILKTMDERGITQKQLTNQVGVNAQTFTRWKYENCRSYMKYLDRIAATLEVTRDYLMNGTVQMTTSSYSLDELDLIKEYRPLNESKKKLIRNIIQAIKTW